jgi:predicted nuclease with TOPRIM domain
MRQEGHLCDILVEEKLYRRIFGNMLPDADNPNSLDRLQALKRHQDEIDRRLQELEESKSRLEDHLASLDARIYIQRMASQADEISISTDFKINFCRIYNKRISTLVSIAELVTEVLLPANLPITIPALVAIKLSKIGIEHYCANLDGD